MKNPLWACSALAISNSEILLIGGKNTNRNGEVHLFNVNTKNWKPLHHMNQLRVSHKSFFIQNKIYVIGGDYDMSCEVYDILENKWSFISSYNSLLGNSLYSFSSAIAISDWSNLYQTRFTFRFIIFKFTIKSRNATIHPFFILFSIPQHLNFINKTKTSLSYHYGIVYSYA